MVDEILTGAEIGQLLKIPNKVGYMMAPNAELACFNGQELGCFRFQDLDTRIVSQVAGPAASDCSTPKGGR